jgi:gas vesicle protein
LGWLLDFGERLATFVVQDSQSRIRSKAPQARENRFESAVKLLKGWHMIGNGSKLDYFLGGLGIGALVGLLFARRSGEESRDYLNQRVKEGKEYAQRKTLEIRERAEDFVERGKQIVAEQKEVISKAVDAGLEAYQREKSKEPI